MKRTLHFLILMCILPQAFSFSVCAQIINPASECDNMDFRRGDFTNWTGHTSVYPPSTPGTNINIPYYYNTGIVNGRQTIMSTSVPDPYTCNSVMTLPPNEPFCARLGNGGIGWWGNGVDWQRDYLSYTLVVTPQNALLTYKYAVVLQDPNNDATNPPHPPPLRPRFIVSILDSTGTVVDPTCGYFAVVVDSTVPGFRNCSLAGLTSAGGNPSSPAGVVYRAWTTVGVDLRQYVGKSITLQFETWDCGLGGHFGYAYISSRCDAFQLQTQTCARNGAILITAPDGFSYKWQPGGQTTQEIYVYNPAPGDSVSVEMTSVTGCKTTLGTRIYPTIAKANFLANPGIVCPKSPVAFTDSSYSTNTFNNAPVPLATWNWNFGDGTTSTIPSPTHSYNTPGTYTVSLAITTQNGCTDSIQKIVRVMPVPIPNFVTNDICAGNTALFVDSSQVSGSGQIITGWTWTFKDNNATSSLQNTTHLYPAPGTYTINLAIQTNRGCVNDTSKTIKIWPLPIANFVANDVCIGNTTLFTDKSLPGDPGDVLTNWIWNFEDTTALSSSTNPPHIFLYAGTHYVQLIVSTSRGCVKDTTLNVIVHPLPQPNFSANPICQGSPVLFHDLSTPTGTITSWNWSFGDILNNTSTLQNPSHVFDSSRIYYPTLVVTSQYGCTDSITLPLNIVPLPVVSFDANKYNGCSPLCVNFVDMSFSQGDPITNWTWTFGDGAGSALQNPPHCYPNPGIYNVTLSVSTVNSCMQSLAWNSMITVYAHPVAGFDPSPTETTEDTPLITFTDQSSGANGWRWTFGDNSGVTARDTSHLYSKPGTYLIWQYVKNQYGCLDSTSKEIVITPEWTFYVPNAFTPGTSIGVNDGFIAKGTNITDFEMWIFDRWGNNLYHCTDLNQPWNGKVQNGADGEIVAQQDVYVWKIYLKDVFGNPHNYLGTVTLIK
jgi:PKD repeat protein